MLVVGGGAVGRCCAWLLQRRGHQVRLLDAGLNGPASPEAGSWAALGVLMAQVSHRSSGRGWRLRQRSLALWDQWIEALEQGGAPPIPRRRGLLLLAADGAEWERLQRLAASKQALGLPLELWSPAQLQRLQPELPRGALGGLHSPRDGQLDPGPAMAALLSDALRHGLQASAAAAERLERSPGGWRVVDGAGEVHRARWLVLTAGLGSARLLAPLGHPLALEPVLGQALELELRDHPGWSWPGVAVWRGLNLVPRPDLPGGRRCWLGATLEPGHQAGAEALAALRRWGDAAVGWLAEARECRRWQGCRCRPVGQPAPLLQELEPGLLLAAGHHRNGILLAPASAAWVCERIEAGTAAPPQQGRP